jgi:hypothetical protein
VGEVLLALVNILVEEVAVVVEVVTAEAMVDIMDLEAIVNYGGSPGCEYRGGYSDGRLGHGKQGGRYGGVGGRQDNYNEGEKLWQW